MTGVFINPYGQATPQGYQMPQQAKSAHDYAKALMSGSGQQPIHHWTQGVSNMVSALTGGLLDNSTAQNERASQLYDAGEAQNAALLQNGQQPVPPPTQRNQ